MPQTMFEFPAELHVMKVTYQDRDYRYPARYPAPKHRPVQFRDAIPYLSIVAGFAALGMVIAVASCLGG